MEVFRISRDKYAIGLVASGKASRWNKDNQFVIYTSASRSLATLENVVHLNSIHPTFIYRTMVISLSDDQSLFKIIAEDELPDGWRSAQSYAACQDLGSEWYAKNESLILKVPSVIIPHEYNYIINMSHPSFNSYNASLVRNENYFWDERLFRE
jgi:RES domain-containing protein